MAGCLLAITFLLIVFLYFFQKMRELQNVRFSLSLGWSVFFIFAICLLCVSLFVLVLFSYLNYEASKKIKSIIEEQNKIEIEKIKNGEFEVEDKTTFDINYKLETNNLSDFKDNKNIQKSLFAIYVPILIICTVIVFVVLFSLSYLTSNFMLMIIFGAYFLIPLFVYLSLFYFIPKHISDTSKKNNIKEKIVIKNDKIIYSKYKKDNCLFEETIKFVEFNRVKETDEYFFFNSDLNLKQTYVYIKKTDIKDVKTIDYISLKAKQINGVVAIINRGEI